MERYVKPEVSQAEIEGAFSDGYRALWNEEVQKKIDKDIEALLKKADEDIKKIIVRDNLANNNPRK